MEKRGAADGLDWNSTFYCINENKGRKKTNNGIKYRLKAS